MPAPVPAVDQLAQRLAATYAHIGATRMAGLPLLNPRLQVQALGFAVEPDAPVACGALVTPWCLNLMRLPLAPAAVLLGPGELAERTLAGHALTFIGGHEALLGPDGRYEMCSLFSPMHEFADQAAAVATAQALLALLRPAPPEQPAQPARRGFLFGRAAPRVPA